MNLARLLRILRGRIGTFAAVLAATVLAAALVSLVLPRTYRATVSLLVDARDEQSLERHLRAMVMPQERLNYMQTQMDILTSRRVASQVVRDLGLAQDPQWLSAFRSQSAHPGPIEDWITEQLLKRIKVNTSQSNVIHASVTSSDARFAAQAANAFAKAYIDTILELRVEPVRQAAAWFDEQLNSLRANLEDAQAKLTRYQQRQGIVSTDERHDIENSRLGTLADQLARAQEQSALWQGRAREGRDFVARAGAADALPEVFDNAYIQRLKSDLAGAETKLANLAALYGRNYPAYQRQEAETAGLRERLDSEMKKVVAGIENSARQSRSREGEATRWLEAQRARVLALKEHRNDLTVLRRNVESAERAYDTALQRSVVSRVDSRASQANVTLLGAATVPTQPASPRIALSMALSLAVGVVLGVGTVLLVEGLDRRVRSLEDLEELAGAPVLGLVPASLGRGESPVLALGGPSAWSLPRGS